MGSLTVGGLTVIFPDTIPNADRVPALEAAWNRVRPTGHWKGPISAIVERVSDAELDAIKEAIVFFTATEATVTKLAPGMFSITAPGYWAGPAN